MLGVDPLPPPGTRREPAGDPAGEKAGSEAKGGGGGDPSEEPDAKKPRLEEPQKD